MATPAAPRPASPVGAPFRLAPGRSGGVFSSPAPQTRLVQCAAGFGAGNARRQVGWSMYAIYPSRLDLAREFKANPYGEHSPELQYLLHLMRRPSDQPFHQLVMTEPFRRWTLAVQDPVNSGPP